jgi:pimeloyl-ACP methyl ester carboxylesterase
VILFIHGLANYGAVWNWNISELQHSCRCIAIDLPGNGHSGRQHKTYSIDFYAESVILFAKEMKLKNLTLAGHSMGGLIALKIALKGLPGLMNLVLFAPAGFEYYTPGESVLFKSAIAMGNFLNLDETQIAQSVRTSFYRQNKIAEIIIRELSAIIQQNDRSRYRAMLEQSIHSMLDDDIFIHLKEIPLPVLVFFGESDMLIPNRFLHPVSTRDIAVKGCGQLPHATLITYPDTGHFVQIEQAAAVNEAIKKFLKKGS